MENKKNSLSPKEWVENYSDFLYNYALGKIGDQDLAKDLIQETFLAAYKSKNKFKGQASERTWLVSILKNKIIDEYRKRSKRINQEYSIDFFQSDEDDRPGFWKMEHLISEKVIRSDADLENHELAEILQECISALPKSHKTVFRMKNLDGVGTEEISKELNISKSNLWVILHRSRLALRECIKKKWL